MKARTVSLFCLLLFVAPVSAKAQHAYRQLYQFGFVEFAASAPYSGLVEGPEGWLYGACEGANGGVIYRVKKDGSAISIVFDFGEVNGSPSGSLIVGSDGALYGTMISFFGPEVYRIRTDGSEFRMYPVDIGLQEVSGVIEGTDGRLYGATSAGGANEAGALFAIGKDGSDLTVLHEFAGSPSEGQHPGEPLEGSDGWLYLATSFGGLENGGTICRISKSGSGFSVLHHFPGLGANDGRVPNGKLVEGPGGYLYGTTDDGGIGGEEEFFAGLGVVYRISTNGSDYSLVRRFEGSFNDGERPRNILMGSDGRLYGTAQYAGYARNVDAIFRMDITGESFSLIYTWVAADGETIRLNGIIESADGNVYGTSAGGGANHSGEVFKVRPNGTQYQGLHHFSPLTGDGTAPYALVLDADGTLYGSTHHGGANDRGTIYKLETNGAYRILHHFSGQSGFSLGMLAASDDLLYGGSYFGKHIFQISKEGSGYTVLTNLAGAPVGPLIEGTDFLLYGVTEDGGTHNFGSVFRLNADGTDLRELHSFTNLASPLGVLEGSDNWLYGVTHRGGTNDQGAVFKLTKEGSQYQVLHSFGTSGGPNLLCEGSDGFLYGTTHRGGANGQGTIYRITKSGGYALINSFAVGRGNPVGQLAEGPGGWLYGAAQLSGDFGGGLLFRFKMGASSDIYILHHFGQGKLGSQPNATMVVGLAGELYGTTEFGGFGGGFGTVFRVDVRPILTIQRVESEIELSWPWNGDHYALQATDNLGSSFTSLGSGTNNADRVIATVPLGTGSRFYRLEKVPPPPGAGQ